MKSWQLKQYGGEALWDQGRGAGVRVAVLDAAIAPSKVLPDSRLTSLDARGKAGPPQTSDHGYSCAALIGADHSAAPGLAPECEILSLSIETTSGPDTSLVTKAIRSALQLDVDVINCSFVLRVVTPGLLEALRDAHLAGVPIIAAGGNSTALVPFPHHCRDVVVVGSITRSRQPMTGQFSRWIDVSTWGEKLHVPTPGSGTGTTLWRGHSSGAAALVSGLVALGFTPLTRSERRLRGKSVESLLTETADRSSHSKSLPLVDAPRFIAALREKS